MYCNIIIGWVISHFEEHLKYQDFLDKRWLVLPVMGYTACLYLYQICQQPEFDISLIILNFWPDFQTLTQIHITRRNIEKHLTTGPAQLNIWTWFIVTNCFYLYLFISVASDRKNNCTTRSSNTFSDLLLNCSQLYRNHARLFFSFES